MRIYFDIVDLNIWEVIENGFHTPIKIINGCTFSKPRNEWDDVEKRLAHLDAIAKMIIIDALTQDEFVRISKCADARDMWNTLKFAHEEIDEIKESESTNKEEEEQNDELNFCLMGRDDDEVFSFEPSPSYEELQDAFEELHDESLKLAKKLFVSKQKISSLENEIEKLKDEFSVIKEENSDLEKQNESLLEENENFKNHASSSKSCCKCENFEKEIEDLKNTLSKFTQGRDNLNVLLGKQRCVFNKAGLGFKTKTNQKYHKNFFVPARMSSSPFSTCFYCGLKGHKSYFCEFKNNHSYGVKKKWVVKKTHEPDGSKHIWIPKKTN